MNHSSAHLRLDQTWRKIPLSSRQNKDLRRPLDLPVDRLSLIPGKDELDACNCNVCDGAATKRTTTATFTSI